MLILSITISLTVRNGIMYVTLLAIFPVKIKLVRQLFLFYNIEVVIIYRPFLPNIFNLQTYTQ